jgi:hypothetical protein
MSHSLLDLDSILTEYILWMLDQLVGVCLLFCFLLIKYMSMHILIYIYTLAVFSFVSSLVVLLA